jgi:hypothetical protein
MFLQHPLLTLSHHQLALDGVAGSLFMKDLLHRYTTGRSLLHPAIQKSYVNVCLHFLLVFYQFIITQQICACVDSWQKQTINEKQDVLRRYWMAHLGIEHGKDFHFPFLIVPFANKSNKKQINGREVKISLKHHAKAIAQVTKQIGVHSASVFLSLWILLLSNYANQDSVVVESTFHGRTRTIFTHTTGMDIQILKV